MKRTIDRSAVTPAPSVAVQEKETLQSRLSAWSANRVKRKHKHADGDTRVAEVTWDNSYHPILLLIKYLCTHPDVARTTKYAREAMEYEIFCAIRGMYAMYDHPIHLRILPVDVQSVMMHHLFPDRVKRHSVYNPITPYGPQWTYDEVTKGNMIEYVFLHNGTAQEYYMKIHPTITEPTCVARLNSARSWEEGMEIIMEARQLSTYLLNAQMLYTDDQDKCTPHNYTSVNIKPAVQSIIEKFSRGAMYLRMCADTNASYNDDPDGYNGQMLAHMAETMITHCLSRGKFVLDTVSEGEARAVREALFHIYCRSQYYVVLALYAQGRIDEACVMIHMLRPPPPIKPTDKPLPPGTLYVLMPWEIDRRALPVFIKILELKKDLYKDHIAELKKII